MAYDVAIIGGGPSGTTTASLLKKYKPECNVVIFEREKFPRDHVGESQLPSISAILNEMGCWDKVEAANFPIKIGATYRWGKTPELWDFNFILREIFQDERRPAKYSGQRVFTAFQVDRAEYDKILLDHARELGVEVRENAKVTKINREEDTVIGLELDTGETIEAKYYVDASGTSGVLRRAFDIECEYPTNLRNIAIWDYWQNAEWAVEIGTGGTRIQVLTVDIGWLWFIPLGPTRTSIGLVMPAERYKNSGKKPSELYHEAIRGEEIVRQLVAKATCENKLQTTRDWSFLSKRAAGENWLLVGESLGFADPILSAGLTLAHHGAREAAYTLLELLRGKLDPKWLREEYSSRQLQRVRTHIRFADYWYTTNAQFQDLQEFTSELAASNGLSLSPEDAWRWLAQGGFINEDVAPGTGGFSFLFLKGSGDYLGDLTMGSPLEENNVFKLNLAGASWKDRAWYRDGAVVKDPCYVRGDRVLPICDIFEFAVHVLQRYSKLSDIITYLGAEMSRKQDDPGMRSLVTRFPEALEVMIHDGWVIGEHDPSTPLRTIARKGTFCTWNTDNVAVKG